MEPIQWSEKFSVGVRELDQQHQQLIKMLNRLIATQGTINTHSETISDILIKMTRYAEGHFKTEERLMEAYGFSGLEEQKKKTSRISHKYCRLLYGYIPWGSTGTGSFDCISS